MPLYKNNLLDTLEVTAKRRPVIVNDINDPRLKAYNDSSNIYNTFKRDDKFWSENAVLKRTNMQGRYPENTLLNPTAKLAETKIKPIGYNNYNYTKGKYTADRVSVPVYKQPVQEVIYQEVNKKTVQPTTYTKQQVKSNQQVTQPVVYQKQQVQQAIQPVVQSTQQVPVQQENWTPIQNTIMYNMNGKTMFSTSDKINELFKSDIDEMTKAGVSQETIDSILRQKYQIKERNITYTPSAATQKAINVRASNLYSK